VPNWGVMIFLRRFFEKISYTLFGVHHTNKQESPHNQLNSPCQKKTEATNPTPCNFLILPEKQSNLGPVNGGTSDNVGSDQNEASSAGLRPTNNNTGASNEYPQISPELSSYKHDKGTGVPNANKGKREWGPELYEFFFEHLLSIKNFDPNGLTEKLTLA
jgi:hypothetical protein